MERFRGELSNAALQGSIRPLVLGIAVCVGSDPTPPPPGGRGYGNSPGGIGLINQGNFGGRIILKGFIPPSPSLWGYKRKIVVHAWYEIPSSGTKTHMHKLGEASVLDKGPQLGSGGPGTRQKCGRTAWGDSGTAQEGPALHNKGTDSDLRMAGPRNQIREPTYRT